MFDWDFRQIPNRFQAGKRKDLTPYEPEVPVHSWGCSSPL